MSQICDSGSLRVKLPTSEEVVKVAPQYKELSTGNGRGSRIVT